VDDVTALALAARDGDRVALSDLIRSTWADVGRLVAVLSRLDLDPRTAFVLTQLMRSDCAGAAEVCRRPVGTIRSRVARARTQLVAEMGLVEAGGGTGGAEAGAGGAVVAEPDEPPVRP
jgi:DNA-directed RNA polymerase specialized sigma24 family protein